jgi:hypothetical protein
LTLIVVLGLACPAPAWAQRVPHQGSSAVGGDVGLFIPRESGMSTGPALAGFLEHYLSARDSVRLVVGWASPKFETENTDGVRQVRVGGDLLHNWEGGSVHPFVGAGLGLYFLQERDNGRNVGNSETKFGGNVLGGVEYFTSNTFSIKGEAAYHVITKIDQFNPSGLQLSVGAKVYF